MQRGGRRRELLVHRAAHRPAIGERRRIAPARAPPGAPPGPPPSPQPAGSDNSSAAVPTRSRSQAKYRIVRGLSVSAISPHLGVGMVSIEPSDLITVLVPLPFGTTIAVPPPGMVIV